MARDVTEPITPSRFSSSLFNPLYHWRPAAQPIAGAVVHCGAAGHADRPSQTTAFHTRFHRQSDRKQNTMAQGGSVIFANTLCGQPPARRHPTNHGLAAAALAQRPWRRCRAALAYRIRRAECAKRWQRLMRMLTHRVRPPLMLPRVASGSTALPSALAPRSQNIPRMNPGANAVSGLTRTTGSSNCPLTE